MLLTLSIFLTSWSSYYIIICLTSLENYCGEVGRGWILKLRRSGWNSCSASLLKCVWPWASQLCLSFCAIHSYCVCKVPGTRQVFGSHYCEPDVSHSVYARSSVLQGTEPIQGWVFSFCGESRPLSPSFQWFPFPSTPQFGCVNVGSFKLYSFHIFIWTVRCKKGCWEKTL